jgi:hypothetical protein
MQPHANGARRAEDGQRLATGNLAPDAISRESIDYLFCPSSGETNKTRAGQGPRRVSGETREQETD